MRWYVLRTFAYMAMFSFSPMGGDYRRVSSFWHLSGKLSTFTQQYIAFNASPTFGLHSPGAIVKVRSNYVFMSPYIFAIASRKFLMRYEVDH